MKGSGWNLPKILWTGWCWSNFERLEGLAAPCNMHPSSVQCLWAAICIWHLTAICIHPALRTSVWAKFEQPENLCSCGWHGLSASRMTMAMAIFAGFQLNRLQHDLQPEAEVIWRGFHSLTRIDNTQTNHIVRWGKPSGCSTAWLGSTMPAASNVIVILWLTITLRVDQWPLVHQYALQWLDNQYVGHRPAWS